MPSLVVYPVGDRSRAVTLWPYIPASNYPTTSSKKSTRTTSSCEMLLIPITQNSLWMTSPWKPFGALMRLLRDGSGRQIFTPVTSPFESNMPLEQDEFEITVDDRSVEADSFQFDSMVRDILEDTTALFALSGYRAGVAKGIGPKVPPLARLEFLRSRIQGTRNHDLGYHEESGVSLVARASGKTIGFGSNDKCTGS